MTDLAAFILARIEDDQAVARAATAGPWWYDPTKWNSLSHEESVFAGSRGLAATTIASTGPGDDPQSMADAAHIARHDPARVLAQCAALRQIVEAADGATGLDMQVDSEFRVGPRDTDAEPYLGDVLLRALASIWAEHEDYDPAWRLG